MNLKTNLANRGNYGDARTLSSIRFIVIHYTANDGDTDENNGNYFKNNVVQASAHYFVDDDSVTRSVPDDHIAWHCGAKNYNHSTCRNSNSIGVELCDDVKNGTIYPSAKTIANALELVEYLMKKYNVPKENVIRHYDVCFKLCPAYWCGNAANDAKWKTEFWNKLGAAESGASAKVESLSGGTKTPDASAPSTLYRVQVGAFTLKKNATLKCNAVKAAGFDAFVVQVGTLWKVQVGAFSKKANAENMVKELQKAGISSFVTQTGGAAESIMVGSKVMVKNGAKTYEGQTLATFIYDRVHEVKQISGSRVVISYGGVVVAAVHKNNLMLV